MRQKSRRPPEKSFAWPRGKPQKYTAPNSKPTAPEVERDAKRPQAAAPPNGRVTQSVCRTQSRLLSHLFQLFSNTRLHNVSFSRGAPGAALALAFFAFPLRVLRGASDVTGAQSAASNVMERCGVCSRAAEATAPETADFARPRGRKQKDTARNSKHTAPEVERDAKMPQAAAPPNGCVTQAVCGTQPRRQHHFFKPSQTRDCIT